MIKEPGYHEDIGNGEKPAPSDPTINHSEAEILTDKTRTHEEPRTRQIIDALNSSDYLLTRYAGFLGMRSRIDDEKLKAIIDKISFDKVEGVTNLSTEERQYLTEKLDPFINFIAHNYPEQTDVVTPENIQISLPVEDIQYRAQLRTTFVDRVLALKEEYSEVISQLNLDEIFPPTALTEVEQELRSPEHIKTAIDQATLYDGDTTRSTLKLEVISKQFDLHIQSLSVCLRELIRIQQGRHAIDQELITASTQLENLEQEFESRNSRQSSLRKATERVLPNSRNNTLVREIAHIKAKCSTLSEVQSDRQKNIESELGHFRRATTELNHGLSMAISSLRDKMVNPIVPSSDKVEDRLYLVRCTGQLPNIHGNYLTLSPPGDNHLAPFCRHTIHFSMNHVVNSHHFGNWDESELVYLLPFSHETDLDHIIGFAPDDTFVLGEQKIPPNSIIFTSQYTPLAIPTERASDIKIIYCENPRTQAQNFLHKLPAHSTQFTPNDIMDYMSKIFPQSRAVSMASIAHDSHPIKHLDTTIPQFIQRGADGDLSGALLAIQSFVEYCLKVRQKTKYIDLSPSYQSTVRAMTRYLHEHQEQIDTLLESPEHAKLPSTEDLLNSLRQALN